MVLSEIADVLPPRALHKQPGPIFTVCASVVQAYNERTRALNYYVVCPCLEPTGHELVDLDDAVRVLAEHVYTHQDQLRTLGPQPAPAAPAPATEHRCRPVEEERPPGRHR